MEMIRNCVTLLQTKLYCTMQDIKNQEEGDTTFVSMLLIIGIVVVLATGFLSLVNGTLLPSIEGKIQSFLSSLAG